MGDGTSRSPNRLAERARILVPESRMHDHPRRTTGSHRHGATIRFADFELDTERFELRRDGRAVPLEPRTFDLLALLARNIGRTVTRDEIFETIWHDRIVSDAALSSQIKAARRAIGDDGSAQQMIATVHGRGFRMRSSVAHDASTPPTAERYHAIGGPTVAVLPCRSLDPDGRGMIVAQGLTEDVITALSKNRWLRVIARSPAFALGGNPDGIAEVAAKLQADYVVTGTVRRDGVRVRVTVQTLDTREMRCIWNERFDRDMTDIFALQEEISRLVASRIAVELGVTEQKKAARQPRRNLGAWELYQLGSAEFYRFTSESNERSQRLMRQAIQQDPEFGSPLSRLAYAIVLEMVYFEGALDRARLDEALELAQRAVACDDQDANAFFSLGRVRLVRREYELAIDALEEAVRLNPCLALGYCGLGDSLAYEGRIDEALAQFEKAIELSPHDPFRWAFMSYRALAHLFGRQFEEAAQWARRATQVPNCHYWARANLASALGYLGDERQREEAAAALLKCRPDFSRSFAQERLFFVKDPGQIEIFLDGLKLAGIR
jgi:TolB-like protein